jgi:hypothetical protein
MNVAAKQERVSVREELVVSYVVSECFSRLSSFWTRLLHPLQLEPVVVPATFFKRISPAAQQNQNARAKSGLIWHGL